MRDIEAESKKASKATGKWPRGKYDQKSIEVIRRLNDKEFRDAQKAKARAKDQAKARAKARAEAEAEDEGMDQVASPKKRAAKKKKYDFTSRADPQPDVVYD